MKSGLLAAAAAAITVVSAPAHADIFDITFSNLSISDSFQIDSTLGFRKTSRPEFLYFRALNAPLNADYDTVFFGNSQANGYSGYGTDIGEAVDGKLELFTINPAIYSGSGTTINFVPATYTSNGNTLTIARFTGAVPEPTTWAMMLVGFGSIGFAMRRRKSKVTTDVIYA